MRFTVRPPVRAALCAVLLSAAVQADAALLTIDAGDYLIGHGPGEGEIRNSFNFHLDARSGLAPEAGTMLEVELNSAALADIEPSAGGILPMGGAFAMPERAAAQQPLFGRTNGSSYRARRVLTVADRAEAAAVPAPEILALSGAAMIVFALARMLFRRPVRPREQAEAAISPDPPAPFAAS